MGYMKREAHRKALVSKILEKKSFLSMQLWEGVLPVGDWVEIEITGRVTVKTWDGKVLRGINTNMEVLMAMERLKGWKEI